MARSRVFGEKSVSNMLSELGKQQDAVAKKAVYEGSRIMADAVRKKIQALPIEKIRYLRNGDKFSGITNTQKKDLLDNLGVATIKINDKGDYNAHIGFDGYGTYQTKAYPKGIPIRLLARSIESGSSVRNKIPFIRPAFNEAKKKAERAMADVVKAEIENITK